MPAVTRRPRRIPLIGAALAVVLLVAVLVVAVSDGSDAAPPPPAPLADVRDRMGAPEVGDGLSAVVQVEQSVVPGAFLRRFALPDGEIRGRLWVAAPDRWRLELQGIGHDWQLTREGGLLRLYWDGSQTAYALPVSDLPATRLAAIGPTEVRWPVPDTVAGRPVYRVTYVPEGEGLLVARIEVAADSATGVPLEVAVHAVGREDPVVRMRATSVEEEEVPGSRVTVRPPEAGETVPLGLLLSLGRQQAALEVVGEGWGRALRLLALPEGAEGLLRALGGGGGDDDDEEAPPAALQTPLVSFLGTPDGVLVGPVTLDRLEAYDRG